MPSSLATSANVEEDSYKLKCINFLGRRTSILLQNENGPCPLLALSNVLLLRNRLSFSEDTQRVPFSRLIGELSNIVLDSNQRYLDDPTTRENFKQNIEEVISILPSLNVGLDVNCRFTCPTAFEYTKELSLFDLFDVTVVHGWILSQEDSIAYSIISPLSYNQLVEKYVAYRELLAHLSSSGKTNFRGVSTENLQSAADDGRARAVVDEESGSGVEDISCRREEWSVGSKDVLADYLKHGSSPSCCHHSESEREPPFHEEILKDIFKEEVINDAKQRSQTYYDNSEELHDQSHKTLPLISTTTVDGETSYKDHNDKWKVDASVDTLRKNSNNTNSNNCSGGYQCKTSSLETNQSENVASSSFSVLPKANIIVSASSPTTTSSVPAISSTVFDLIDLSDQPSSSLSKFATPPLQLPVSQSLLDCDGQNNNIPEAIRFESNLQQNELSVEYEDEEKQIYNGENNKKEMFSDDTTDFVESPVIQETVGTEVSSCSCSTSSSSVSQSVTSINHLSSIEIDKLLQEGPVISSFLDVTAGQFTYEGLVALHHQSVKERQLVVFFRNNHFSTMFRFNDKLYLLATDVGFADMLNVVWEQLDSMDGNTVYCNEEFLSPEQQQCCRTSPAAVNATSTCMSNVVSRNSQRSGREAADEGGFSISQTLSSCPPQTITSSRAGRNTRTPHSRSNLDEDYALAMSLQLQEQQEMNRIGLSSPLVQSSSTAASRPFPPRYPPPVNPPSSDESSANSMTPKIQKAKDKRKKKDCSVM